MSINHVQHLLLLLRNYFLIPTTAGFATIEGFSKHPAAQYGFLKAEIISQMTNCTQRTSVTPCSLDFSRTRV
jgi:hypothetical protein